jgi:type I restriction enzyme S subunit
MICDLRPYPAMKDSGVPWLGEVPGHWDVQKLRTLLEPVSDRNRPDLPLLSVVRNKGVIKRDLTSKDENHNFIPDDLSNYKVVRAGQFAMNKMKAWQGSYGVSQYYGIVSPAYFVFDLRKVGSEFFHTAIRSRMYVPFFTQSSDGVRIGQWDLAQALMKEIPFFVPSPNEQATIVRYLDHMDRRIRKYIRAKQKLIKLLEEQKQAIIHRAVTRGLDPNVRLKPSGVEWLGEVPEHWEVVPLRWYISIKSGDFIETERVRNEATHDQPYPVIGGNGVMGYAGTYNSQDTTIVIGRVGALCGNVHLVNVTAWITDNALRVSSIKGFDPDYLATQLRAMNLNRLANANAQPLVTGSMIKSQHVMKPSIEEQKVLVTRLHVLTEPVESALIKAQHEIALLREYRTRLIADVVTGKLDVREAAARLPEEGDKPEPPDEADALSDAVEETEVVEEPEE